MRVRKERDVRRFGSPDRVRLSYLARALADFAATTKEPADMEEAQELEVKLVNLFFKGDPNPALRRAWAAYRHRLLFHHRVEG
jgi:hypothetical protein